MTSLWLDHAPLINTDPFESGAEFDEVVVGAGITGLVTALLFARAGHRVAVVEGRFVGAAATGNTTAKLSQLQGTHLSRIREAMYPAVMQAYADGNRAAFDWMTAYLDARGVPYDRRDAVTYAATEDGVPMVRREYELARSVGLDVDLSGAAELPFATHAAVTLADQGQFDPMRVLAALAADVRVLGGRIFEGARVTGVRTSSPSRVTTALGEVFARHVILATGTPVLDRGLYFAKVKAHRSYALAFRVPGGELPRGMFIGAESPTRSIRTHRDTHYGELLLTGGNGHGVGRHPSPARAMRELEDWTAERWVGAERTHAWAAQDYIAPHHVPFVGYLPRGRHRVLLATGYEKWGMTNSVAAAHTMVADVLGDHAPWQRALRRRVTTPRAFATGVGENLAVGWWYAKGYARTLSRRLPSEPPVEGEGVTGRRGVRPMGVSTVDGRSCTVSTVCPHLFAALGWNDGEKSWDCPAHGSRFAPDGSVLEGPAKHGLRRP
ncbi:MAG: FAD-dependent oxidoreductase [Rhodoglobus sp.]|nr:FAD-dependent oxidoreductase [Rhodoglobus sp.]